MGDRDALLWIQLAYNAFLYNYIKNKQLQIFYTTVIGSFRNGLTAAYIPIGYYIYLTYCTYMLYYCSINTCLIHCTTRELIPCREPFMMRIDYCYAKSIHQLIAIKKLLVPGRTSLSTYNTLTYIISLFRVQT